MKKIFQNKLIFLGAIVGVFIIGISGVILAKNIFSSTEDVHFHAGFIVVSDNHIQDFSDLKYMKVEPCATEETDHELTPEEEQIEKAHLHDLIGDVVHVHRKGATWGDLFRNIKYEIDYDHVKAYVNGTLVEEIEQWEIQPYDSLVLLEGEGNPEEYLPHAVPQSRILEAESRSENCGS